MGAKHGSLAGMVVTMAFDLSLYTGKRVLVTGHSGFKGTWLCRMLILAGADVYGYSLPLENDGMTAFYDVAEVNDAITVTWGDIRDLASLQSAFENANPDFVFHLAAQPLVIDGYREPVYTYETNVMGTVNILECLRQHMEQHPQKRLSFVNVTTDKVYENKEWEWGYRENEPLDGYDPYSNSKSCSELVTHSYKNSFLDAMNVAVSTARAGNVIGGGDFADNRIIPDCVRAAFKGKNIQVRNPHSMRPYQHVLEPLYAYLMIGAKQYEDGSYAGYYNVGPDEVDCVTTGQLVDLFCKFWGNGQSWTYEAMINNPHEANLLKLDCSKLKRTFGWHPVWRVSEAVEKTVEWAKCYQEKGNIPALMNLQIEEFLASRIGL